MIIKFNKEVNNNLKPAILKVIRENLPYYFPNLKFIRISRSCIIFDFIKKIKNKKLIQKKLLSFINKTILDYSSLKYKILYKHKTIKQKKLKNPFEFLIKNNQINQNDRGKFVYRKNFSKLFFALDTLIKKEAIKHGATEEIYPSTIKTSTLIKSKYLKSFPQHAYFVAPSKVDQKILKKLNNYGVNSKNKKGIPNNVLGQLDHSLCPSACYPFFEAGENKELPIQMVTSLVNCHRFEVSDVKHLQRLQSYWVREIIFYNNQKNNQKNLSNFMKWINKTLVRWEINFEISTANDPFFLDVGRKVVKFQSAQNLKHELLLNYNNNKKIAVGSFNNHLNHLTNAFKFKSKRKIPHTSACIGFGIDRFLYALFWQLGININKWPKKIKKDLKINQITKS